MNDTLLRLGDIIQLQPLGASSPERYAVRLIGIAGGQSLIAVSVESRTLALGEQYIARCLSGMNVYAFTTDVIKVAIDPYSYIHLSYPQEVQSVGVRQSERVQVSIPAEIRLSSGESHPATLTDLSHTGAQVAAGSGLGKAGDKVTLAFDLVFAGVSNQFLPDICFRSPRSQ